MKNYENYLEDLVKSRRTPLLIELNKKDLVQFGSIELTKQDVEELKKFDNELNIGFAVALLTAKETYDKPLETSQSNATNLIFIDANTNSQENQCLILEQIVKQIDDSLKKIYNLNIAKEGIKTALSFGASGFVSNLFGDYIDKGVDFIGDIISGDLTEELVEFTLDEFSPDEAILGEIQDRVFTTINDSTVNALDSLKDTQLYLSAESKDLIYESSKKFGANLSASELYQLIVKVICDISTDMAIVLFIKDPHKLDVNSIALLSLLLSIGKDVKDRSTHTGVSIVYAYEDETFQPYKACEEQYLAQQKLLDEQRLFTQRYAMLEKPSSDIPHVAVKSHVFVGRVNELIQLKDNYFNLKKQSQYSTQEETIVSSNVTSLQVIKADPGVGKTKLVKKHFEQLRATQDDGLTMIQLTLLNQAGHNSMNAGLGGFTNSIIKEAERLEGVKTLTQKALDKGKDYIKDKALDAIKDILDNNVMDTLKAIHDSGNLSKKLQSFQKSDMENISTVSKEEEFEKLNSAIKTLIDAYASDTAMPIVLFIDDLQWIDDKASEYITQHLIKKFDVYIVATLRGGDATNVLKQSLKQQSLNEFKIALLEEAGVIDGEKQSNHTIQTVQTYIISLKGFDETVLSELISLVIDGKNEQHHILAQSIIETLNTSQKEYVNTLFAVETINMLCDEKFYESMNEQLIIYNEFDSKIAMKFNDAIKDFKGSLQTTFTALKDNYETAFNHPSSDNFGQHFNLMAYAVLEERLKILESYFAEHGNAAVNTLLFSSLIGTPFNSTIVKNVLEELSSTQEELLQPLKEYINEECQEISLTPEHYEIIDEVYEILSRYLPIKKTYSYRHNLLEIFLDKQLEYKISIAYKDLPIDTIEVKKKLYELFINQIGEEINIILKSLGIKNIYNERHLLREHNCIEPFDYLSYIGYNISKKLYTLNSDCESLIYFMSLVIFSKNVISDVSDILLNDFLKVSVDILDKKIKIIPISGTIFLSIFEEMNYTKGYEKLIQAYDRLDCEEEYQKATFIGPLLLKLVDLDSDLAVEYSDIMKDILNNNTYVRENHIVEYDNAYLVYHLGAIKYFYNKKRYQECLELSTKIHNENTCNLSENPDLYLVVYKYRVISILEIGSVKDILNESSTYSQNIVSAYVIAMKNSSKFEFTNHFSIVLDTMVNIYNSLKKISLQKLTSHEIEQLNDQAGFYHKCLDRFANEIEYTNMNNELISIIHSINFNVLSKDILVNDSKTIDIQKSIDKYEDSPERNFESFFIDTCDILTYGSFDERKTITKYLVSNIEDIPDLFLQKALYGIVCYLIPYNYNIDSVELLKIQNLINKDKLLTQHEKDLMLVGINLYQVNLQEFSEKFHNIIKKIENLDSTEKGEFIDMLVYLITVKLLDESIKNNFIFDDYILRYFIDTYHSMNEFPNKYAGCIFLLNYYMKYIVILFKNRNLYSNKLLFLEVILIFLRNQNISLNVAELMFLDDFIVVMNDIHDDERFNQNTNEIFELMVELNLVLKVEQYT